MEKSIEGAGQLECSKREETVLLTAVSSVPRTVFGILQGLRKPLLNEKSTRVPGGMKQPQCKEYMKGRGTLIRPELTCQAREKEHPGLLRRWKKKFKAVAK